jgi:phytoene dehydrogenase-like protein
MKNRLSGDNVIVIGAGAGGLSAGILLTLLGYRVTIVEKNRVPGGLMRSYVRHGFDCPVGVHYVGALGGDEPLGKMFQAMGISVEDFFLRMGRAGVIDRYIFDDFTFDLPAGFAAYEENLKSACPADNNAVDILMKNIRQTAREIKDPSFILNQGNPFQNIDQFRPMGELLDEIGASPRLRAILAVPCKLIGVGLDECPVIFHHMILAGYLLSSWRPKDGGAALADAFAERFRELGGSLVLGSSVRKIEVAGRTVTGVVLDDDEKLAADAVVAAIHPGVLAGLLAENALRASQRERISSLRDTEGVIVVHATVGASECPATEHNIYRLHHDLHGVITDGIFYQVRSCDNGTSLLSAITRSEYGNWSRWEDTVSGRRGTVYEEKKQRAASEIIDRAADVFGPLENFRILDVFTPLTVRDYVNCPRGACYGLLRSAGQLMKIASVSRLSVGGLFSAGQNKVAPGLLGSILGSFQVAAEIAGVERFTGCFRQIL